MAIFLNTTSPLENYRSIVSARFFADKTWLLDEILETVKTDNRSISASPDRGVSERLLWPTWGLFGKGF